MDANCTRAFYIYIVLTRTRQQCEPIVATGRAFNQRKSIPCACAFTIKLSTTENNFDHFPKFSET